MITICISKWTENLRFRLNQSFGIQRSKEEPYYNIALLLIVESQELLLKPKTKFSAHFDIFLEDTL